MAGLVKAASRPMLREGESLMGIKRYLPLVFGLVVTFGAVQADAEDRFFEVNVKLIAGGLSPFFDAPDRPDSNCYSFLDDGTWIDPKFPNPIGTWVPEDSAGVVDHYTAMANWGGIPDVLPPLLLVQEGQITPGTRNGKVRIQAFSTLFVDQTDIVLAMFMSTGHEVEECPSSADD
jgi:hypothetical protein